VMAGALRVQLAGDAWYFGSLHKKPFIGEDDRPIVPADIRRANQLMFAAQGILAAVLAAALAAV
ncbi:MAG: cobalamin biosynthesis protein CobD, partial [Clostridium sp.]|nr:cobalamin biosynthesis protein CobD [Clostridium sp.]